MTHQEKMTIVKKYQAWLLSNSVIERSNAYISLYIDDVTLDGTFSLQELRFILETMEKIQKEIDNENSHI